MANSEDIIIKDIIDFTDDDIDKIKFKDDIKLNRSKASFINLTKPIMIFLPEKFCYGAKPFSDDINPNQQFTEKKFSLSYSISINSENEQERELDNKIYTIFNKITDKMNKELTLMNSKNIKSLIYNIQCKTQKKNISVIGFKPVIPPNGKTATPGKYSIYLSLILHNSSNPNIKPTVIVNEKNEILEPREIINTNNKLNMGLYFNFITINGITIVNNEKINLTFSWMKCRFIRSNNRYEEKMNKAWDAAIAAKNIPKQLEEKNIDDDDDDKFSFNNELVDITENKINSEDLEKYSKQMEFLSLDQ